MYRLILFLSYVISRSLVFAQTQSECDEAAFNEVWDYEVRYVSGVGGNTFQGGGCLHVDRVTTFARVVEVLTGLKEDWCQEDSYKSVQCMDQIMKLTEMQFGPPSAFEVMNVVCKGACQDYYNRYKRVKNAEKNSKCACEDLKSMCPKHPNEMLCDIYPGLCYDPAFYWESTCQPYSCGRFAQDEATYRKTRQDCKLDFDGAYSSHPAITVMLTVLIAIIIQLFS
jgi:hypothetical protein